MPITHMGFKLNMGAFLMELKEKDRLSAKKREYINGTVVWSEAGLKVLYIVKQRNGSPEDIGRRIDLEE